MTTQQLRSRRDGKADRSWYADETYVKVGGKWCYLYRAIDRDGNKEVTGRVPQRVTIDRHNSYPCAIRNIPGRKVIHWTSRLALTELPYYRMEQDHREIKQRYYPMRGFGSFGGHHDFAGGSMRSATISGAARSRKK